MTDNCLVWGRDVLKCFEIWLWQSLIFITFASRGVKVFCLASLKYSLNFSFNPFNDKNFHASECIELNFLFLWSLESELESMFIQCTPIVSSLCASIFAHFSCNTNFLLQTNTKINVADVLLFYCDQRLEIRYNKFVKKFSGWRKFYSRVYLK